MEMPWGSRQPDQIVSSDNSSPEKPHYYYTPDEGGATDLFMIVCDEGWRSSIVAIGMYEWAAQWLVQQLQGKPYAPGLRP